MRSRVMRGFPCSASANHVDHCRTTGHIILETTGRTLAKPVVTSQAPQDFAMAARSRHVALVVTGGQSGADRAATDVAVALSVPYGGWVPKGGWAEDFPEPPGLLGPYPGFRESPSDDPADRTGRNVLDADATLLCLPDHVRSPGSELTWRLAGAARRTRTVIDPFSANASSQLGAFAEQLDGRGVLNVAGPRATECDGIYDAVHALLCSCSDVLFGARP